MTAAATLYDVTPGTERRTFAAQLALAYSALWLVFLIGGFRLPWEPIPLDEDVTFSLRRQLVFTFGGLLALHAMTKAGSFSLRIGLHLPWVAFSLLLVASLAWTTDGGLTAKRSLVHGFGILLLLATVDAHPRPVRFFLTTVTLALGACAWLSLAQEQLWSRACWSIPWRPGLAGLSGHPNVFGPCMQVGLLLSLALRPELPSRRLALHALRAGMAVALWKTDSMTSITTTITGAAVFILLATNSYRAGLIQLGLVLAFGVALVIGAGELRDAFFSSTGRDASLSGRDHLWERVLDEAKEAPLVGTGFGAFWYPDRGRELVLTWNPKQAHNSWIDVFVEIGWTGLIAFALLIPLRLLGFWQRCAGVRGTARRDAAAAIFASTLVLFALASRSESFFLRMDKLQWFVTVWGLLLLENRGANDFDGEFGKASRR
ncbi:MAG: O-antigen ligase family protein [Planctomycetes bacterium]|nr:O-antigen ligase family protein [Planctomycetota bacterium]